MVDYVPVAEGGPYSYVAASQITGGQIVELTADNTVQPAAVTSAKVFGVAAFDTPTGGRCTTYDIDKLHETTVSAAGTLTAGNPVKAGALGTLQLYVVGTDPINTFLGVVVQGATAGNLARWRGY